MTALLLNSTLIWLISLVCFDLFFKRDTHHGYNRVYLLFTFLAGLLIPFFKWPSDNNTVATLSQPLKTRIVSTQETISHTMQPAASNIQWQDVITWIYLTGVLVSTLLLLRELLLMFRLYHGAKKTKDGKWTIVSTGKQHGPFSIFHFIFINDVALYEPEELAIVLNHEKAHGRLLHALDLCFIQIAQVALWFHPLVYVYRKRLLMIHEYQADAMITVQPQTYGRFLISQSMLHHAPSFSHSLNHSPIKNRIIMLTKNASSQKNLVKYLLVLPVLVLTLMCCSKTTNVAYEKKKDGNKITYKGNVFELSESSNDTMVVVDPATGKNEQTIIEVTPYPVKMNGMKIYQDHEVDKVPVYKGKSTDLATDLLNHVKADLEKQPDGQYQIFINNIIVDSKGQLVYFESQGISKNPHSYTMQEEDGKKLLKGNPDDNKSTEMDKAGKDAINKKIELYLSNEDIEFSPAIKNGQPVICNTDGGFRFQRSITVENHKANITTATE